MVPLYSGDPTGRLLYELVVGLWLATEVWHGLGVVVREVRDGPRDGRRQDRFSGPALIVGVGLAIWIGVRAGLFVPQAAMTFARPELFAAGLVVALGGIGLRWYSIARLGRFFTTRVTVAADQVVVDTGPYRIVRHPSYS